MPDAGLRHPLPGGPDGACRTVRPVAGLDAGEAPLMTRMAQGPLLVDGQVGDPLTPRA